MEHMVAAVHPVLLLEDMIWDGKEFVPFFMICPIPDGESLREDILQVGEAAEKLLYGKLSNLFKRGFKEKLSAKEIHALADEIVSEFRQGRSLLVISGRSLDHERTFCRLRNRIEDRYTFQEHGRVKGRDFDTDLDVIPVEQLQEAALEAAEAETLREYCLDAAGIPLKWRGTLADYILEPRRVPLAEIAEREGVSVQAVSQRLRRYRRLLLKILKKISIRRV